METVITVILGLIFAVGITCCENSCEKQSQIDNKATESICKPICKEYPIITLRDGKCYCDTTKVIRDAGGKKKHNLMD